MNLKPEDAALLIAQTRTDDIVLIGGQAVAFWIGYFNIEPQLAALTRDIDYLGTKAEARRASARLKVPHRLRIATLDDATPGTALLAVDMAGYPEPVLIDYLAEIVGVSSGEITRSAVTLEFQGEPLRVIHPLQLLQAKIWNLYRLAAKRTPEGIEQARLAIEIVIAFVERAGMSQRDLLKTVETIGRFAATTPARYARDHHRLDCLAAVPPSVFEHGMLPPAFHEKRWPQILAAAR